MHAERGFTFVETLVAAAIALLLGWQLLVMTHALAIGAAHLDGRLRARASADRLEERLISDAATTWSVFVPNIGAGDESNADGHEMDFVTEDASHAPVWWAYAYDRASKRVTRYAYVPGGAVVAGERYDDLDGFTARSHAIADLGKRNADIYDPLFAQASAPDVELHFGWNPAAPGGNRLTAVHLTGDGIDRTLLLASATAPTRFTVVVKYTPAPAPTP